MSQTYPELGFFVLGGHIQNPQPLADHVRLGQELGLGAVCLSERPGSKDIGVLCGAAAAAGPVASTIAICRAARLSRPPRWGAI